MDKQNSITIYNDLDQKRYFIESENDHLLVNGEKTENINLIGSGTQKIELDNTYPKFILENLSEFNEFILE